MTFAQQIADAAQIRATQRNAEAVVLAQIDEIPESWKQYAKSRAFYETRFTRANRLWHRGEMTCEAHFRAASDAVHSKRDKPEDWDRRRWRNWLKGVATQKGPFSP